jgi:biopolymer transport protein ExbD
VLVQHDTIHIGVGRSAGYAPTEAKRVSDKDGQRYDWTKFEQDLMKLKSEPDFEDRGDIEVAAQTTDPTKPVHYSDIIQAMDVAVKVGFTQVNLSQPTDLSWRP